jgi:sugar lactone lactonase YvrE
VGASFTAIHPQWTVPGGRIVVEGTGITVDRRGPPSVTVAGESAQVHFASSTRLRLSVPITAPGGRAQVRVDPDDQDAGIVEIAHRLATGLHLVDNPAFDGLGRLFVTHSGGRGAKVAVPIYRIDANGMREPLAVEVANPTGFALGPDGAMYVSSRFEGQVHRLTTDDQVELYASDLGVPTGLAFARDGSLFVGDRSGSIFRIGTDRRVETWASLPGSVAAFHLAVGPDDALYVAAPTLSSHDVIYRITPERLVETYIDGFGRPQGLAFDATGDLYVVDALAGASTLYRIPSGSAGRAPDVVLTAPMLIGLAFDPAGGLVIASSDTVWRLDVPLRPLPLVFLN